jgi:hypothetical protein
MNEAVKPVPDPRVEDVWVAHLMGPTHFYPKGSSISICGCKGWEAQCWNMTTEMPVKDGLLCPECVSLCLRT